MFESSAHQRTTSGFDQKTQMLFTNGLLPPSQASKAGQQDRLRNISALNVQRRVSGLPVQMSASVGSKGLQQSFPQSRFPEFIENSKQSVQKQDLAQFDTVSSQTDLQNKQRTFETTNFEIFEKNTRTPSQFASLKIRANQNFIGASQNVVMRENLQQEMKHDYGSIRNFSQIIKNKNSDRIVQDTQVKDKSVPSVEEEFKISYGFFKQNQKQKSDLQELPPKISIDSVYLPSQKDKRFQIENDYIDREFNDMTEQMEKEATQAAYAAQNDDVTEYLMKMRHDQTKDQMINMVYQFSD